MHALRKPLYNSIMLVKRFGFKFQYYAVYHYIKMDTFIGIDNIIRSFLGSRAGRLIAELWHLITGRWYLLSSSDPNLCLFRHSIGWLQKLDPISILASLSKVSITPKVCGVGWGLPTSYGLSGKYPIKPRLIFIKTEVPNVRVVASSIILVLVNRWN